jgi:hypothetical protein
LRAGKDGSNALHLLAYAGLDAEVYPAELVYFAAANSSASELALLLESANDLGHTPYDVSTPWPLPPPLPPPLYARV